MSPPMPESEQQDTSLPGSDKVQIPEDNAPLITSGHSIHDQQSVLGDSGRLYHGYKQGKYFLPNDAVSSLTT
jgi:hypothetical protein